MNNFNLGEVLTTSWKTIWKHKVLWVFGILASFARGGGGSSAGGGNSGYQTGSGDVSFPIEKFERGMQQVAQFFEQNLWIIITGVVILVLLSFLLYAAGMMGRIGLIKGVYKVETGAERLSFGELWSESMPYFWRIFGMNFLFGLAFVLIFIPLVIFGFVTMGIGFICILPLLCILVPISWVIAVVMEQAQPAIVLENLGIVDGLKRGWQIVKTNAISMILLAIVLAVGGAIIGLVIALPIILSVLPIFIGMNALNESFTPVYIALACCALYLPVIIFLNGILTAYIQSVWTLAYLRLTKPTESAAVVVGNA
ncbi:MAG TPA: hypothetical protein VJL10_11420 [Anaerolineales bacterium]|nr:hypothetical protein [Anaerolineales bacterium]